MVQLSTIRFLYTYSIAKIGQEKERFFTQKESKNQGHFYTKKEQKIRDVFTQLIRAKNEWKEYRLICVQKILLGALFCVKNTVQKNIKCKVYTNYFLNLKRNKKNVKYR